MNHELRIKIRKIAQGVLVPMCTLLCLVASLAASSQAPLAATAQAQTLSSPDQTENINQSTFQVSVCNGPPGEPNPPSGYVPCDFNHLMILIQHVIDIMLIFGVIAAIAGFIWAGYIYISAGIVGNSDAHSKALGIFKKVALGFIIMLSAWFIVDQVLIWLTGSNSGFMFLLGNGS